MLDTEKKLKKGRQLAVWATIVTFALSILKGLIGYFFKNKLLIADAFHSGADTIAILASAFGLFLASKKKSQRFPYGLYRAETLGTLVIGSFIFGAGIELLNDGYQKLFILNESQNFPYLPVAVSIVSAIVAFIIALKEKSIGEEIGSQSLIANAKESFLDIISSGVVLAGIVLAYLEIAYVEGIIIILISLVILKLGLENIWNSLLILMDANLDSKLHKKIEELILNVYGITQVNEIKIRQSGPFKMVEITFATNPSITIYQAHELGNEVEKIISEQCENIESIFIHIEPSNQEQITAIIPVKNMNGLDSLIFGHFGRAPYFIILKIKNGNIEIEDFYLNEFLKKTKHIGLNVVKIVVSYGLDMLFTAQIGEISFYMLKENFIDIYKIPKENITVREVIENYLDNNLVRITAPTHSVDESIVTISDSTYP